MHFITNDGYSPSILGSLELQEVMHMVTSVYNTDNWRVTGGSVTTNLQINTSCRAPGNVYRSTPAAHQVMYTDQHLLPRTR